MKSYFFILTLLIIIFPFSLSAQSGCFISKDSSFYCQTIDKEQAIEECQNKQCNLETSFIENKDCTKENFPQCEQILCKSSCQQDFLGNCLSGPIPDDNKEEWCTPGCCAYLANEQVKCSYQNRKGICEAQARNKNEPEFYYQPLDKQSCESLCTTKIATIQDLEENDFLIYKVQSFKTISNNSTPSQPTTEKTKTESKTSPTEKKESSSNSFIWLLAIIIFAGISYYFYTRQQKHQSPTEEVRLTQPESLFTTSSTSLIPQFNFKTTPQSEALKHLHTTKVKEHERDDFFQTFGNFATKAQYEGSHLKTLKNIVELYERKKLSIPPTLTPKEKKALDLLQDLVSKTKQQTPSSPPQISIQSKPQPKPQPKLSPLQQKKKKELDDVLSALRQISKNT